jgi:hypothetical protein
MVSIKDPRTLGGLCSKLIMLNLVPETMDCFQNRFQLLGRLRWFSFENFVRI